MEESLLPSDADRVVIAQNPMAGRYSADDRVERLKKLLLARGMDPIVSLCLDEVTFETEQAFRHSRLRALVGVGGDGTIAELVNRTSMGVPITMLPAGTSNLLAKHFRFGPSPVDVCETIATGKVARLDAGRANGRVFLMMVGCGFDAEVVRRVDLHRRQSSTGHISFCNYGKPILKTIRSYRYPEIRTYCDDRVEERVPDIVAKWVFALNLPRYGWGMPLAPDAVATDGRLDLCTFHGGSFFSGLKYLAAIPFGCQYCLPDAETRRVSRLRIVSDEPVSYQLDGDIGGMLPLKIEVVPDRLSLLVPPSLESSL